MYGYGCCAFKHNICGDLLKVPDGMLDSFVLLPLKFFANPRCPLVSTTIEDIKAKPHLSETTQEP